MISQFQSLNLLQFDLGGASGGVASPLIMFGLIALIFYFLIIRPQNKQQKELKKMLEQLKKGDKVQSIGGIRGTIVSTKDDSVIVEVDNGVKLEFVRSAIASVVNPEAKAKAEEKKSGKKEKETKEA